MKRAVAGVLGCLCALTSSPVLEAPDAPRARPSLELGVAAAVAKAKTRTRTKKKKPRSLARCVTYSQSQGDTEMVLELGNACERDLSCTLRWTLQCHRPAGSRAGGTAGDTAGDKAGDTAGDKAGDGAGGSASGSDRRQHDREFAILDGTEHTVSASAAECGDDGWSIRDVRWSCRDLVE